MQSYLGFGFDTNDIGVEQIVHFVKTFDKANAENAIDLEKASDEEIIEWAESGTYEGTAEYIRKVINRLESPEDIQKDLLWSCENFVYFESISFVDEDETTRWRANKIKSSNDFIGLIEKYFDVTGFRFGSVYNGSEFSDPDLYLEVY